MFIAILRRRLQSLPRTFPQGLAFAAGVFGIMLAAPAFAADAKTDLAPTGTLRGIFLGGNPVQGVRDSATGEYSGAVPDMLKEIARKLGVPYRLIPGENAKVVMDAGPVSKSARQPAKLSR